MALTFELCEPQALAVGFHLYNLSINFRPEVSAFGSQSECHLPIAGGMNNASEFISGDRYHNF